jgi:hypothetical protein
LKGDRVEDGITKPSGKPSIPFDDDGLGQLWHIIMAAGRPNQTPDPFVLHELLNYWHTPTERPPWKSNFDGGRSTQFRDLAGRPPEIGGSWMALDLAKMANCGGSQESIG